MNKWYMHNPELVQETKNALLDFDIQTDHRISFRWLDLVKVNKINE